MIAYIKNYLAARGSHLVQGYQVVLETLLCPAVLGNQECPSPPGVLACLDQGHLGNPSLLSHQEGLFFEHITKVVRTL